MKKNSAFTVIAQNYVGYGIVLAESMQKSNPDVDFYIYFADGVNEEISALMETRGIKFFDATKTVDANVFLSLAFKYEITEYCTSIKPFIILQLLSQGYASTTYIDPDIYVYQSLHMPIFSHFENGASVVLTPHICSPIADDKLPGEQIHLKTGTYNLGFVSVKNDNVGRDIATWWANKCREACFNDANSGLFVDQKWMNLVPGMFAGVYISRHLGLNMAYWNLHERTLHNGLVNGGDPLIFFHFSGFMMHDINAISKYQNRYTLDLRPDLKALFENYRSAVTSVIERLNHLPKYKYNSYSDGKTISLLARRCYYFKQNELTCPFSSLLAEKEFVGFLAKNGIKETHASDGVSMAGDINNKAKIINKAMRIALKLIGPHRYVSLCKYFGFLSSLHQQLFILDEYKDNNVINDGRENLKR